MSHTKIYAQHNFLILQHYCAVLPYQPACDENYFQLSTSKFRILFSFFCCPLWVSIFCLPADEATMKSVKNNSPTDSEKQTPVASKDKGLLLTKLLHCQILTTLVKTPPILASLASLTLVCVVCVCLHRIH